MKTTCFLLIGLLLVPFFATGQEEKDIEHTSQAWLGVFTQTRVSKKISLWGDFHLRRTDFFDRWRNIVIRPGITYHITDHLRSTLGYAFVVQYPEGSTGTFRYEHRPWQQLNWNNKYKRLYLNQWFRIEERFLQKLVDNQRTNDYQFNLRFRYMVMLQVPLNKPSIEKNTLAAVAGTEVFLNAGKKIVYNTFDQNRAFLGLAYYPIKPLNLQLCYMNVFQQTTAGDHYTSAHVLRLFLFYNIDLRKKEGQ